MLLELGTRVVVNDKYKNVGYLAARSSYTDLYEGKVGTVIKYTQANDKYGIEFDEPVFTDYHSKRSSQDNGCHGKGKDHHCMYLPLTCVYPTSIGSSHPTEKMTRVIISKYHHI
jgi:hypothetical protein